MFFPASYIYDGPSGIRCELGDMAAMRLRRGISCLSTSNPSLGCWPHRLPRISNTPSVHSSGLNNVSMYKYPASQTTSTSRTWGPFSQTPNEYLILVPIKVGPGRHGTRSDVRSLLTGWLASTYLDPVHLPRLPLSEVVEH